MPPSPAAPSDAVPRGDRGAGWARLGRPFLQRAIFTLERFGAHELANHAAAGAYAFLLSATPALLLAVGIARLFLDRSPALVERILAAVREALGPLGADAIEQAFFERPAVGLAAILGAVGLVWASRLFVLAVQRGLRVIWDVSATAAPLRENLLTIGLELLCLVAGLLLLGAAAAAEALFGAIAGTAGGGFIGRTSLAWLGAAGQLAPLLALGSFAWLTIRLVPKDRPPRSVATIASLVCVLGYALVSRVLELFIDAARYDLLYGVAGGIVVLLLKVYAFFQIYFACAEYAYVEAHLDALLFGRLFRLSRSKSPARLERILFSAPRRLLGPWGRSFAPGEAIFKAGDGGKEAWYVSGGRVGIWLPEGEGERLVATIGPGEIFGEIAHFLAEPRSATARAFEECSLLVIPPAVVDHFIGHDRGAARSVIDTLAARLGEANARLLASGQERVEPAFGEDAPGAAAASEGVAPALDPDSPP